MDREAGNCEWLDDAIKVSDDAIHAWATERRTKPALNRNGKLPETFENERRQDIQVDEQLAETCNSISHVQTCTKSY
jgi:predicted hotdog family 3-hydroxylacyl-ACP dehydratase